ncbi:MAG TPA: hypothetical protein VJR27_00495 [Candidatus Saccharimonadales bacterium]|nr:hypothetical protein [Candidatus Saccharimonadales bacterium]
MRYYTNFASAYGSGVYGACAYNDATTCTTSGGTSAGTGSNPASGGLVNTGFVLLVIATVACLLIFAGFIVRFWRRPRHMAAEPVHTEDDNHTPDKPQD